MSWKSSLLVVAVALLAGVPEARAAGGLMVGVNGGVTIPTGDFGSSDATNGLGAKAGPQAGLEVSYMVNDRFAIGVDGSWLSNKLGVEGTVEDLGGGLTLTVNKDKFRLLRFGAHGKYMFPMEGSPVSPYAVVGAGIYNLKEDYEWTVFDSNTSTSVVFTDESASSNQIGSRPGGKLGFGTTFKATDKVGIDVQVSYNVISLDKAKSGISSAQYIGIQAGVNFNIMSR
jgi:outer membrane protein W